MSPIEVTSEDDAGTITSDIHAEDEIDRLVAERLEYRKEKRWKEADKIKMILQAEPYCVELYDRSDGSTVWRKIDQKNNKPPAKIVQWSRMDAAVSSLVSSQTVETNETDIADELQIVLATVDAPHYRERLRDTLDHLTEVNSHSDNNTRLCPEPIDLLDLSKHPAIGARRILYEGWRTILLPRLLRREGGAEYQYRDGFVLVAEDDVRFSSHWKPSRIRNECVAALRSNPNVHLLSLGHAWATPGPTRRQRRRARKQSSYYKDMDMSTSTTKTEKKAPSRSLLQHLQEGGGIHATTLFAIRAPEGLRFLLDALNGVKQEGKKTHLDQFLFLSTLHNVGLALSDPPLVGWAEVSTTLNSVGPGNRRWGGGRLGQLPGKSNDGNDCVEWVQRKIVTEEEFRIG